MSTEIAKQEDLDPELYRKAQERMCELLKARGAHSDPNQVMGSAIWLKYLEPDGCNPGAIWQKPDEPWWVHWTAWTPDGSRYGIADDRTQAICAVEHLWMSWL